MMSMHVDDSARKRSRFTSVVQVDRLQDLLFREEDVGDELVLTFHLDLEVLLGIVQQCSFGPHLRSLEICPPFDDNAITADLRLSHPYPLMCFPSLERLHIRNHAISAVVIDQRSFPRLRELHISHPLGVSIDTFRVSCPDTLEDVSLEYMTIRDGEGLCKALSFANHPKLKSVRKFAITTYLQGVI
jgi:hypothetical protein